MFKIVKISIAIQLWVGYKWYNIRLFVGNCGKREGKASDTHTDLFRFSYYNNIIYYIPTYRHHPAMVLSTIRTLGTC